MKRQFRKNLLLLLTISSLTISIFIPATSVSAFTDQQVDSVPIILSGEYGLIYQRPLYPFDIDSGVDVDGTFDTNDILAANESVRPLDLVGDFAYDALEINPSVAGMYTFTVSDENLNYARNDLSNPGTDDRDHDLMFWLYQDGFDPEDPLTGVLAVNDTAASIASGAYGMYPELSYDLSADTTYFLIVTTYYPETTGTVTLSIIHPLADVPPGDDHPAADPPEMDDPPTDPPAEDPPAEDLPQQNEPPVDEFSPDPQTPSAISDSSSSGFVPVKRDPITILHSATGVRTEDLSYFAAIPEQWMADVTYVEFWLDAVAVEDDSDQQSDVIAAAAALRSAGLTLYGTQTISLISRVTWRDRTQVTSVIDPDCIRANIPVLLLVPMDLIGTPGLGIVCIDDKGAVAQIDSEQVTMDGVEYLRFENNNLPAVYGFVGR